MCLYLCAVSQPCALLRSAAGPGHATCSFLNSEDGVLQSVLLFAGDLHHLHGQK